MKRKRIRIRGTIRRLVSITNIGAAILLVLSAYSHLIDPNVFLIPAFLGLAFLPLLAINLGFIVFWLFIKPRRGFVGLTTIALSWGTFSKHIQLTSPASSQDEASTGIMSFNARLFDLYNWGGNKETRNEIFDYLKQEDPDIICFQEFFHTNDPTYFNTLDTMVQFLSASKVHDHYTSILHYGKSKFGIATFSKYPILDRQVIPLDTAANNAAICTDLIIGKDTVRIYNIHLASVYISSIQQELSDHIEQNDPDGQLRDAEIITKRLSAGFKRRARQSQVIKAHMEASPYPIILCGDLNDTPGSYAYAELSRGLNDAFVEAGQGIGATYLGMFPGLRIDFILVDPELQLNGFKTEDKKLSDHKPLIADVSI